MRNISFFSLRSLQEQEPITPDRSWFVPRAKKPSAETIACKALDLGRLFPNLLGQCILVLARTTWPETQQEITRPWYSARVIPATKNLACDQALLFGRVKRVSRERASERRSREARFACPNRRACSQATKNLITTESRLISTKIISWLEREFPLIVRFYLHFW